MPVEMKSGSHCCETGSVDARIHYDARRKGVSRFSPLASRWLAVTIRTPCREAGPGESAMADPKPGRTIDGGIRPGRIPAIASQEGRRWGRVGCLHVATRAAGPSAPRRTSVRLTTAPARRRPRARLPCTDGIRPRALQLTRQPTPAGHAAPVQEGKRPACPRPGLRRIARRLSRRAGASASARRCRASSVPACRWRVPHAASRAPG